MNSNHRWFLHLLWRLTSPGNEDVLICINASFMTQRVLKPWWWMVGAFTSQWRMPAGTLGPKRGWLWRPTSPGNEDVLICINASFMTQRVLKPWWLWTYQNSAVKRASAKAIPGWVTSWEVWFRGAKSGQYCVIEGGSLHLSSYTPWRRASWILFNSPHLLKSCISPCIVYTCVNGIFYLLNPNPSLVLYIVYIRIVKVYICVLHI
jgi:hypothetical protein